MDLNSIFNIQFQRNSPCHAHPFCSHKHYWFIPIIINLRKRGGRIESGKATFVSGILMIVFLFLGQSILSLFGIDFQSFAMAGAIIIFLISLEMILGKDFFHSDPESKSGSIVPLAFPLIVGAGTMTTLLSLRAPIPCQTCW